MSRSATDMRWRRRRLERRAPRYPHRHHGQGQPPRPGGLCPADPAASASRASSRSSGRRSATRTSRGSPASSARRSATPTSPSARSACSAIRSRTATSTGETLAGWETLIDNAHLFGTDMRRRLHRPRPRQAARPTACRASRRSGAGSPSAPPTRACASPSRTAPWTATGRAATGTSPTTPTPGS